jgi:hypothetical protein
VSLPSPRQVNEADSFISFLKVRTNSNLQFYNGIQIHARDFPVLSRIACDILAIPGVSISVERLFSSSKHTMADSQSSMTATSASKTVVAKEWLKQGRGNGINYLDGHQITNKYN